MFRLVRYFASVLTHPRVGTTSCRRGAIVLSFAILAAQYLVAAVPVAWASTYNCTSNPNTSSGNCYGINIWTGTAGGASTELVPASISPGTNHWWINNEEWLYDSGGSYWVEAGVTAGPIQSGPYCSSPCYFWADERPWPGGYNEHYFASVPSQDFGHYANVKIAVYPYDTTRWSINIQGYSGTLYSGASTSNGMSPNQIHIGMEVYGNSGQSAAKVTFSYNQWGDYSYPTQRWTYQQVNGSSSVQSPVSASWAVSPSQDSSHTGGIWQTWCC